MSTLETHGDVSRESNGTPLRLSVRPRLLRGCADEARIERESYGYEVSVVRRVPVRVRLWRNKSIRFLALISFALVLVAALIEGVYGMGGDNPEAPTGATEQPAP